MINNIYDRYLVRKIIFDLNKFVDCIIFVYMILSRVFIILNALNEIENDYLYKILSRIEDFKVLTTERLYIADR